MSVNVNIWIEVIRSTLRRIVSEVENIQCRGRTTVVSVPNWEQFGNWNLAYIVIRELFEVTLNVSWSQRTTTTSEEWVDSVPCQQASVEATTKGCFI